MAVKHVFVSGKAAAADATVVDGPNWDDNHTFPPFSELLSAGNVVWTNMPAAAGEFHGSSYARTRVDLTRATDVRLVVRVRTAGFAGSQLYMEWSTDESTWSELGAGSQRIALDGAAATKTTAWFAPAAGALADVFLRVMGVGGDGVADPAFGVIALQVR